MECTMVTYRKWNVVPALIFTALFVRALDSFRPTNTTTACYHSAECGLHKIFCEGDMIVIQRVEYVSKSNPDCNGTVNCDYSVDVSQCCSADDSDSFFPYKQDHFIPLLEKCSGKSECEFAAEWTTINRTTQVTTASVIENKCVNDSQIAYLDQNRTVSGRSVYMKNSNNSLIPGEIYTCRLTADDDGSHNVTVRAADMRCQEEITCGQINISSEMPIQVTNITGPLQFLANTPTPFLVRANVTFEEEQPIIWISFEADVKLVLTCRVQDTYTSTTVSIETTQPDRSADTSTGTTADLSTFTSPETSTDSSTNTSSNIPTGTSTDTQRLKTTTGSPTRDKLTSDDNTAAIVGGTLAPIVLIVIVVVAVVLYRKSNKTARLGQDMDKTRLNNNELLVVEPVNLQSVENVPEKEIQEVNGVDKNQEINQTEKDGDKMKPIGYVNSVFMERL